MNKPKIHILIHGMTYNLKTKPRVFIRSNCNRIIFYNYYKRQF